MAPVSCANVAVDLSTDGGATFPDVLLASTANDGSESVTVPNTSSSQSRVRVSCVGNVFFDVSNANFSIVPLGPPVDLASILPVAGSPFGGTPVTLTGTDFVSGATVTFDGVAATTVVFNGPTSLTATTPAHTAGAVDVLVTNPDTQSDTLTLAYTYDPNAPDLPFSDGFEDGLLDEWSDATP
jgi:hypothetical protein